MNAKRILFALGLTMATAMSVAQSQAASHKLVLIAGRPSHPPGMHEFRAGCLLLQKCLANVPGLTTLVCSNGWPEDVKTFDDANAVIIYADGGGGHPAIQADRIQFLDKLLDKGIGFGVMHYACEVPKDKGGTQFLDWVGGYYEDRHSCNPMWTPEFTSFPTHPSTKGVKPFGVLDEWYFNIRFRSNMEGITPLLVAKPSDKVRNGPYVWPKGPYQHVVDAKGRDEIMMWAIERKDGGRSFGFTGGHYHNNWSDSNFRKIVLNAMLWVSKVPVPEAGVDSTIVPEEIKMNLDPKGK